MAGAAENARHAAVPRWPAMSSSVSLGPLAFAADRLLAVGLLIAFLFLVDRILVAENGRAAPATGMAVLVGLVAGYFGYRALAGMDEYTLEVLITLAIVMGGYALCSQLHISGPLAMAVAGLLIGNQGVTFAMSDVTRDYVIKFWELVDELLNSVLFLLIGLEMIVLTITGEVLLFGLLAIPLTLIARAIGIFVSTKTIPAARLQDKGAGRVLWWGGLRGGISVALALSLPPGETRDFILAGTFAAVLFSVLVQRATLGMLIDKLKDDKAPAIEGDGKATAPSIH